MAKCEYCGKEMLTAKGCRKIMIPIKRKGLMDPIRFGDPRERWNGERFSGRCGDCGCKPGGYHHPGCDIETCPNCGGQIISCGCVYSVDTELSRQQVLAEIANIESVLDNKLYESSLEKFGYEYDLEEYKELLDDPCFKAGKEKEGLSDGK